MAFEYRPQDIEGKWQKKWEEAGVFKLDENTDKPAKYILEMFPYPSGDIHMGHVRNYTIGDVMARYWRSRGFDVLHPMGWDAFGLPAENAAIKNNSHPSKWTYENIETQKNSFKQMGFSYDWDRSVVACDPDYYKWGQWIFLQFWKRGLIERKNSPVNWCPSCKTVLANEQVTEGRCWRCDSEVEKRDLTQWYFKITDYAKGLLDDLDQLKDWPEPVKQQQANWIGQSEGAEVDFLLCDKCGNVPQNPQKDDYITVFTTRADTLFGCSFFVLAPEYEGLDELIAGTEYEVEVRKLVASSAKISALQRAQGDHEKHGVFTGRYVVNPVNGEKVPVWVADYVVADYGTGAVMAVPCGDQRDFEFARKYNLEIIPIILSDDDPLYNKLKDQNERVVTSVDWEKALEAEGTLVQSGQYTGMRGGKHSEAEAAIVKALEEQGCGRRKIEYRLRDWLISRQRYWGNPIPAIHCEHCGVVPVLESDLPVRLPEDINLAAGETLATHKTFADCTCPVCGAAAKRETDTMDTFTCSSWYFLRYCDPKNTDLPFGSDVVNRYMPVDHYIGGIEHAILHLLYSRFYTKVFRDSDMLDFDEPFKHLLCQGMVLDEHGEVMSKSKGNVVAPEAMIKRYGTDAVRSYILFMAPPDKELLWNEDGLAGQSRFLNRAWRVVVDLCGKTEADDTFFTGAAAPEKISAYAKTLKRERHRVAAKVDDDFNRYNFNTAISAIMELCNAAIDYLHVASSSVRSKDNALAALDLDVAETLVKLLSPIAPHMTEELWHSALGNDSFLCSEPWPTFDKEAAKIDEIERAVMICGKVKAKIMCAVDAENKDVEAAAIAALGDKLDGLTVRKVIVAGNVVNVVAN